MLLFSCFVWAKRAKPPPVETISFKESWGYLMQEREAEFVNGSPITDLCYFASEVNSYGELESIPQKKTLTKRKKFKFSGRIHTVSVCQSTALTHFILDPQYSARGRLIAQLLDSAKDFDGLQIDYELVPKKDGDYFRSFLQELKAGLGDKILSVAVHARTKDITDDVEDYAKLNEIVDKIFIMAYDEHWSTSKPGSIASMDWCERIADYAITKIDTDKLVMGIPFYGRSWQAENLGRAWYYSGATRIMKEQDAVIHWEGDIPYYKYKKEIEVTCYFEDAASVFMRCRMYKGKQIQNIGFWRLGQEDPDFWQHLKIE